jgi:hypothetical protein
MQFDSSVPDFFSLEFVKKILQNESFWAAFWVIVMIVVVSAAVARRVEDVEDLGGIFILFGGVEDVGNLWDEF